MDVSGRTLAALCHIPGNILKGNWRVVVYVDDKATPTQQEALLNVWTGKLGGPVADLAQLIGEVAGVERVPITFDVQGVKGTLNTGQAIHAELAPFQGATGQFTAMHDTVFPLVALAWLTLWVWGRSPHGRFLSHHQVAEVRGGGALMLVFIAGWTVMIVAMMLPTSLPLVTLFHTIVQRRPDARQLVLLLIAGYLGIWPGSTSSPR